MHDMNATHQPTPTPSPNPHKLLITRRVVLSVYIYISRSNKDIREMEIVGET